MLQRPSDVYRPGNLTGGQMRGLTGLFFFAVLLFIVFFGQAISLYTDWLWFQEVGFTQVFTTSLTVKLVLAVVFGGVFSLLVYFNIKLAAQAPTGMSSFDPENAIDLPGPEIVDPLLQRLLLPAAILLGFFAGPQAASHWEALLLFFNSVPFGLAEPLFGRDIGFYVFQLPALSALYGWVSFTLCV